MIKIVPDKEGKLTQWDLNRKVIVTGYEGVAEVHFASPGDDHGAYVVELIDGEAKIPNILLTMAGTINVYVYPADRTVFATALWVMAREKPDDYVYTETEVLNWRTLDEKIGDLTKLTTTAKENLVAAINEAATKGMASIYMRVAEGYIEYSGDGVNWKQLIAVSELKGEKGDKGDPGSDATVDIVTPTAESTDTQAASAKAVWDMLGDGGGSGGSSTDISLGVTGASVGDIIKVKQVDADGKPTAWEAATVEISGGEGEGRLICDITLSEEVNSIEITSDSDGKSFELSEVWIYYDGSCTNTSKTYFSVSSAESGSTRWIHSVEGISASGTARKGMVHGRLIAPGVVSGEIITINSNVAPYGISAYNIPVSAYNDKITSLKLFTNVALEFAFEAGFRVRVYGR